MHVTLQSGARGEGHCPKLSCGGFLSCIPVLQQRLNSSGLADLELLSGGIGVGLPCGLLASGDM